MISSKFDYFYPSLIKVEGGYVDHPHDPGGKTIWGVTLYNWMRHLKDCGNDDFYRTVRWSKFREDGDFKTDKFTVDDFKALKPEDVKYFYLLDYWNVVKADEMPLGIDCYLFDFSVNSGPSQATKILQRIIRVNDDGRVGPYTVNATHQYTIAKGAKNLIDEYNKERQIFLSKLKNAEHFMRGWNNRLNHVSDTAYEAIRNTYCR